MKRSILALVLCVAAWTGAALPSQARPSRDTVTVALDWTPNTNHTGIYVARALGYYADAGLDVRRTRRPISSLPVIDRTLFAGLFAKRALQLLEASSNEAASILSLRMAPRVGDRGAIAHHVDAALPRAEEAGARDLDSRVDTLVGSVRRGKR